MSEEQTELLRNMWNQMLAMDRSLNKRMDVLAHAISSGLDAVNDRITTLREVIDSRVDAIERRLERLDLRLTRVERHVAIPPA